MAVNDLVEIRVNVPASRETEFYRWFADWRDGSLPTGSGSAKGTTGVDRTERGGVTDVDAAAAWWRLLGQAERDLWSLWIESAPRLLKADEIVSALDLNGPRDIAGTLSWVRRKGQKVGFTVGWEFHNDPIDGSPTYGLRDTDFAEIIRQGREIAEES